MAVKTIITEPNKLLRQISKPVESVGKEEQQLMNDMWIQCMMLMA
jgi:peptide deformylase